MDERSVKRLEFDRVLEKIAGYAQSRTGREMVLSLFPSSDLDQVRQGLRETTEGRELLRLDPAADLGGWHDVSDAVRRAQRGASLEPLELLAIGETAAASRRIKNFFSERRERYPILSGIASQMGIFPDLEREITRSVLPSGELSDRASRDLAAIRRKLASLQRQVKEHLENIIRSPGYSKYLQDPIVTIREGRYVIPVKQEFRGQVPGIVHDQSASGATLFIEPMVVVEANNEVRRLQVAEKQETARILATLSQLVARHGEELLASLAALGRLDFIMAKARYSRELDGMAPAVSEGAFVDLRRARHPLLTGEVVPVDIRLGRDFNVLVITGPNTGGKTVTLKTVGLLVLMAQSGLHIPAGEGTELGIFKQVFADIGDEQSIEQSLSTFSSHLKNIVEILNKAGPDSLVLLDELGAGTDPTEGSALARAILERFRQLGARTVATTHYSELKEYAHTTEQVENASVEFDPVTLKPTYRLLIGRPGRSNAFEIALRLGLDRELVERAREFLSEEQVLLSDLVRDLERERYEAEREREEARVMRIEAERLKQHYEKLERELRAKRDELLARAADEAAALVRRARAEAEETVRALRQKLADESARAREAAIAEARRHFRRLDEEIRGKKPASREPEGEVPAFVRQGEEVFVPRFNQRGFVVECREGGEVQVQLGVMKVNLPLSELRRVERKSVVPGGEMGVAELVRDKAKVVSSRLDLRGKRADEAIMELEKYLDDAFLAGLGRVYLVHGKGTGALRAAVHERLKSHQRVKEYRLGEHGEGGSGVTVVELM